MLFWLAILCFLKQTELNRKSETIFPLSMVIVAYANVYLYGYFNAPIPQTLGLSAILLLLYSLGKFSRETNVLLILFSVLGLIHVMVIPVFILIVFLIWFIQVVSYRVNYEKEVNLRTLSNLSRLVFPITIFGIYLVYTVALIPVIGYLERIVWFLSSLFEEFARYMPTINPGIDRGVLAPLNALAPSFIIGSNLAFILWHFPLNQINSKQETNHWLLSISSLSILFIALGSLRHRFAVVTGWGSIARYFALPGYAFASIGALIVLNRAMIPLILDKSFSPKCKLLLVLALIFISLGGLLDPLTFRTPS